MAASIFNEALVQSMAVADNKSLVVPIIITLGTLARSLAHSHTRTHTRMSTRTHRYGGGVLVDAESDDTEVHTRHTYGTGFAKFWV